MPIDYAGIAYAVTVAAGGVLGFAKAGSIPSLSAGLICGGLLGVGVYQSSKDPKNLWLCLAVSGILTIAMGQRYMKTGKFMPPGLVAGLSVIMSTRYAYLLYNNAPIS